MYFDKTIWASSHFSFYEIFFVSETNYIDINDHREISTKCVPSIKKTYEIPCFNPQKDN